MRGIENKELKEEGEEGQDRQTIEEEVEGNRGKEKEGKGLDLSQ